MRVWRWTALLALGHATRSFSAALESQQSVPSQPPRLSVASILHDAGEQNASTTTNVSGIDTSGASPPSAAALLQWAASDKHTAQVEQAHCLDCFVIIGVKSSAISGFVGRQTIRETWGDATAARAKGVRIVFLGCEPRFEASVLSRDKDAVLDAIEKEKRHFGDLLTRELDGCTDSYFKLVDKSLSFFTWTSIQYPKAAYVLVSDNDTYVRVDRLVALLHAAHTPRERFYGGRVWTSQFNTTIKPIRSPTEKNYVSPDHFPMSVFPPFATGSQYVLSMDLIRFLARNKDSLRGVGTLEDVTVAFWLLSLLHLHPVNLGEFDDIRFQLCHNGLISYTSLSQAGIRAAHANIVNNRSFCNAFSFSSWSKPHELPALLPFQLLGQERQYQPIEFQWDLRYEWATRVAYIVVTLKASQSNETAIAVYYPSQIAYIEFCRDVFFAADATMPSTALYSDFSYELRDKLALFLSTSMIQVPVMKMFFTLALSNLQRGNNDSAVFVRLSAGAMPFRTLIENLMAVMYADVHVYLLDPTDYAERFQPTPLDYDVMATGEYAVPSTGRRPWTRQIVIQTEDSSEQGKAIDHECSVYIVDRPNYHFGLQRAIYLPQASQGFLNRTKHTPLDLLTPSSLNEAHHDREFMVVDCTERAVVAQMAVRVLSKILEGEGMPMIRSICEKTSNNPDFRGLDELVMSFSQFKFALVVEDRLNYEGHISNQIVTAFLAGCIPIYIGHHSTITRVFNRKAFISCHEFESLRKCAEHVVTISKTPSLYHQMREQSPVDDRNRDAFYDAFSWHPAVITPRRLAMAYRLKSMLETIEPQS